VLQEAHLHHSRARVLLHRFEPRLRDYADELHFNDGVDRAVSHTLALFTGSSLRMWPMRRAAIVAARSVAVHEPVFAEELTSESPEASIEVIRPGVADPGPHQELRATRAVAELRARAGAGSDDVVLGLFGPAGRTGRLPEILQALASLRTTHANLFLLLAEPCTGDYDAMADARRRGLVDRVTLIEPLTRHTLGPFLGASDIALSLAWPPDATAAPNWLRPLACGVPTIVTRRREYATLPLLDATTWMLGSLPGASSDHAIGVTVDLSSEQRSLQHAIARLAADPALRRQLGDAGRLWWSSRHTLRHMADDYLAAIDRASRRSAGRAALPAHLRPDVFAHARGLAEAVRTALPPELGWTGRAKQAE
jgi:hypothetical protein